MTNPLSHPENVNEAPFNAIVRFKTYRGKFLWRSKKPNISTGFFIGPQHLLTAGHNFYTKKTNVINSYGAIAEHRGNRILEIENFHRRKRAFVAPEFNSWSRIYTRQRDDYCVVRLDENIAIQSVFSLPDANTTAVAVGTSVYVGGYPLLARSTQFNGNDMHTGHGTVLSISPDGCTFTYDIDTEGGNSGGPVWIATDDERFIAVGIHIAAADNAALGVARLIDHEVLSFIADKGFTTN